MRALVRGIALLLLIAAAVPACDVIPITIPGPAGAADGGPPPSPDLDRGGLDSGVNADIPPINVPDSGPSPFDAVGGGDGPGFIGDALPDGLAPDAGPVLDGAPSPDGVAPTEGGAPDVVAPAEGGAPDSLPPVEGGAADALAGDGSAADALPSADL